MKRIVYNLIICCAAICSLAACIKEGDTFNEYAGTSGNHIILDISSGTLPLTRATAEGAEIAVDHLDVIIFDESETKVWHERRTVNGENKTGKVTLTAKRNDFSKDAKYWVYLIANSKLPETDFSGLNNLDGLKAMQQLDKDIHMTGLANLTNVPQAFLMDGVAYEGTTEPTAAATVALTDGVKSNNTELKVTLRRAAAKIVVKIQKGGDVTFDNSPSSHNAGYYLRNMPYTTSVVSGVDAEAQLMTPDQNNSSYFNWTADLVTVTAYTYAHEWSHESLQKEVRLVVNIPLTYLKDTDPQLRPSNYYQIPVSEQKVLKRNGYYEVTVTINAPGAEDPSKPVTLNDVNYSVKQWDETTINVGGEDGRPIYLTVNEEEMSMYNITDDNTTLRFASSSTVTAKVTRVHYINKFGKEIEDYTSGITITPDPELSGHIKVHSPLPTNNTIRYIDVEIKNDDGVVRTVTIAQYPLEYITNIQGYYSYRSDFGGTTYEDKGPNRYVIADDYNNGDWDYYTSTNSINNPFFVSKYVKTLKNDGSSTLAAYRWKKSSTSPQEDTNYSDALVGLNNARMYHVRIIASSGEYTLGIPRITDGKTDPGKDNAELVSPSFMIASQLGAVLDASSVNMAASHCKEYVETYKDGSGNTVHLDNWRLPTAAEVKIIMKYQKLGVAIDAVLTGTQYWCASGCINTSSGEIVADQGSPIRCIRDAYDGTTSGN